MTAVRERPILFSGPMVRALLDGRKTQTRRVVKLNPPADAHEVFFWSGEGLRRAGWSNVSEPGLWARRNGRDGYIRHVGHCPYGVPGDRLWVKETHYLTDNGDEEFAVYAADESEVGRHLEHVASLERAHRDIDWSRHRKLRPSIHMPRWASRLTLSITDVRVERLQDISEEDCLSEGLERLPPDLHARAWRGAGQPRMPGLIPHYIAAYRDIWNQINGPDSWDANPWVWAITFDVEARP